MTATAPQTTRTSSGIAKANAKLNLTLDVLGERPDGFHEIRSLVIGLDLCDRIRCSPADERGVSLTCTSPGIKREDNLAYRAAVKLAKRLGVKAAVQIAIEKSIPIAAGLGGGSADAAATLMLCHRLWGNKLDDRELADLGAEIGSDVPLFFALPAAVITGRGERVNSVTMRWAGWVLLVFPGIACPTAEVYAAWKATDVAGLPTGMEERIVQATSADELSGMISNHLTRAVYRVAPEIERIHTALRRAGLGSMHITGTGSTLFQLFDKREAACRAADKIEEAQLGVSTAVVAAPVGTRSDLNEE